MIFEWDEAKNQRNIALRDLDFVDAPRLFSGLIALEIDIRRDYGERRFIAIGTVGSRMMVCVYTKRGKIRRIISFRKANRREQDAYR